MYSAGGGPPARFDDSEDILQRELHDSRWLKAGDSSEVYTVEASAGIHRPGAVGKVERLRSKFQSLCFTNPERSGQGQIELPCAGTGNA